MPSKNLLAGLVLALCASGALAATPAKPAFNAPVKIDEGRFGRDGTKPIVHGTTVYAAYGSTSVALNGPEAIRVGRSTNAGATWDVSQVLAASSPAASVVAGSARLAISNDPAASGQKVLHAIWVSSATEWELFYSSFATRNPSAGWSAPVRVHAADLFYGFQQAQIAVTAGGFIHVIVGDAGGLRHFSSPAAGQPFTAGQILPLTAGVNTGEPAMAVDAANTLHVAYVTDCTQLLYTKKPAGSVLWSAPTRAYLAVNPGDLSNNIGLAAADANNLYISYAFADASGVGAIKLASTINGGQSWTSRNLLASYPFSAFSAAPSIIATTGKIVTVAWVVYTSLEPVVAQVRVWRTADAGLTWSPSADLRGHDTPGLALDASNKVHLVVEDAAPADITGTDANLLFYKER